MNTTESKIGKLGQKTNRVGLCSGVVSYYRTRIWCESKTNHKQKLHGVLLVFDYGVLKKYTKKLSFVLFFDFKLLKRLRFS